MTSDDRPFSTRLNELRRDHGLTFRALEARLADYAKAGERGMTNGHLAGLAKGQRVPTPAVVALVARAFDLPPSSFVEWRLWELQEQFDPRRKDGLEAAVAAMHAHLSRAMPATEDAEHRERRPPRRAVPSTAR
jgi:transcriptional regulator with XRE-family HTH domain